MKKQTRNVFAIFMATIPILSFLFQLVFSYFDGNIPILLKNYTVTYVDFVFIPLNYFIIRAINWGNGRKIIIIFLLAFALSCVIHYNWSVNGTDPGHMFDPIGFTYPSGWVHVVFAAFEFCLMLLFIFCYSPVDKITLILITILLETYFIGSLIGGYFIRNKFIAEDIIRISLGCAVFIIYYIFRRVEADRTSN